MENEQHGQAFDPASFEHVPVLLNLSLIHISEPTRRS